ncbi:MAG: fasciclin domain-containing protein [Nocardioidaceae bacterium]|nr:fasciclin domain-containing protein [Nocardioidaceae bacterium]
MRIRTRLVATASALALAATGALALAPAATASGSPGTTPLSDVLLADGDTFDNNKWDYDIVTQAVLTVIDAKGGDTPVALLTQGDVALTAFIPRDIAFYRLVKDLTGSWPSSEQEAFNVVASLGVDTVEKVLLYHVVPGGPIDSAAALGADGARLATADGGNTFKVNVITRPKGSFGIKLVDKDPGLRNPWVIKTQLDINKGNLQIAHGISRVLIPVDL